MKEMRFYIETPYIEIYSLPENDRLKIDYEVKKSDFVGVVNINFAKESIRWGCYEGDEYPVSFNRLIITLIETLEKGTSDFDFLKAAHFVIIDVLETFFDYIQIELGQYWVDIGFMRDWDLPMFVDKTNPTWIVDGEEKSIDSFLIAGLIPKYREYPESFTKLETKHILDIQSHFEQKDFTLSQRLLAQAKRAFFHNDYMASSTLAITALEGPLKTFVKKKGVNAGLKKLPSLINKNELGESIKNWVELSLYRRVNELHENSVIIWAKELYKARNAAVHEGQTPEFDTLDKGIFAIEAILKFIAQQKHEYEKNYPSLIEESNN